MANDAQTRQRENKELQDKLRQLDPNSQQYQRVNQRIEYNNYRINQQVKRGDQIRQTAPKDRAPITRGLKNAKIGNAKSQRQLLRNEQALAAKKTQENIKSQNAASQTNPYGQQNIWVDEQGNVHQDMSLSQNQQGILNRDEALSLMGRDLAQQRLSGGQFGQNFDPMGEGGVLADRGRVEDAVFASLTKDMDYNKGLEKEQLTQTLRNRGIPLGSDLYNQEMKRLDDKYQAVSDNARQTAIAQGGAEMQRNFQLEQAARNQNLNEIGNFAGFSTGQQTPQFQGYQGVGYDMPTATDIYSAVNTVKQGQTALNQSQQQIDLQAQMAKKMGGGGGGYSQQSSPFNNTTMPGV